MSDHDHTLKLSEDGILAIAEHEADDGVNIDALCHRFKVAVRAFSQHRHDAGWHPDRAQLPRPGLYRISLDPDFDMLEIFGRIGDLPPVEEVPAAVAEDASLIAADGARVEARLALEESIRNAVARYRSDPEFATRAKQLVGAMQVRRPKFDVMMAVEAIAALEFIESQAAHG